jgi:hypothetical protein
LKDSGYWSNKIKGIRGSLVSLLKMDMELTDTQTDRFIMVRSKWIDWMGKASTIGQMVIFIKEPLWIIRDMEEVY